MTKLKSRCGEELVAAGSTALAKFASGNALTIDRFDIFMAYAALLDQVFARSEPLSPIVIRRGRDPAITQQV